MPRVDLRSLNVNNLRNYYPCKKSDEEEDERFRFLLPLITGGLIGFPLGYLVNGKNDSEKPMYYPYPIYPQYPQYQEPNLNQMPYNYYPNYNYSNNNYPY